MVPVYEQLKDLHIRKVVIYANSNKAYFDVEHTKQVTTDEAVELMRKGMVVLSVSDVLYTPVGLVTTGATKGFTYLTLSGSTVTGNTLATA